MRSAQHIDFMIFVVVENHHALNRGISCFNAWFQPCQCLIVVFIHASRSVAHKGGLSPGVVGACSRNKFSLWNPCCFCLSFFFRAQSFFLFLTCLQSLCTQNLIFRMLVCPLV